MDRLKKRLVEVLDMNFGYVEELPADAVADRIIASGILPTVKCNVGDTVYQTDGVNVYESTIQNIIYDTGHFAFDDNAIGRSIFLTREEAEAALGGGSSD